MPVTNYEIDRYYIYQYNEDISGFTAQINCQHGNSTRAVFQFYKGGVTPGASFKGANTGILFLRFKENKFRDIIETLRLEKPLSVYFNDDSRLGYLSTSSLEPIGEEEA